MREKTYNEIRQMIDDRMEYKHNSHEFRQFIRRIFDICNRCGLVTSTIGSNGNQVTNPKTYYYCPNGIFVNNNSDKYCENCIDKVREKAELQTWVDTHPEEAAACKDKFDKKRNKDEEKR